MSVGGSTATRRWSVPPNSSRGTPPSGWGQAKRTRRASDTTRRFASTVYNVPSGPRAACTIPVATVSTRPLPKSSDNTSCFAVMTNRNSDSGSSPITLATAGRSARAAQRRPDDLRGTPRGALPLDDRARLPRQTRVIEERALDRGEPHGQEAEHEAAGEREPQLHVRHGDARADQLVERGAARTAAAGRGRARIGALVVDE